jgi:hypothetical protein
MGVLEQITQMKNQGIPDEEIINNLQQQGISPREIDDALNQSRIKNAVSDTGTEDIQPSIMENPPTPIQQNQGIYTPQTQEMSEDTYAPQPGYDQQEVYQQENYDGYSEGTDNMIEIAEQIFSEKIKKLQKQVENINEFKTSAQTEINNTTEKLKRIETIIDKLQIAILEKIGSYGKNLESIKKEMSMMQDSFGKVVNQAVKGHKSHTTQTPIHKITHPKKNASKKK